VSRKKSYLTFTDQFCGAGGSTIGAKKVGLEGRMALNHWKLAIETHLTNHPEIAHDCTDISACDPKRYPATDLLITSPECTTHSPAGGSRRAKPQRDLFLAAEDPATARSRATMWDVPRFAEFHEYNLIIVENVVEAYTLAAVRDMAAGDARARLRSQDRLPQFDVLPPDAAVARSAVCRVLAEREPRAETGLSSASSLRAVREGRPRAADVEERSHGRKVSDSVHLHLPDCRSEVQPYYFAALNALDLSFQLTRIGDRDRALKLRPRTLDRIRYGLEKYGNRYLLVTTNQTNRLGGRVRTVWHPHFTQPGCGVTGLIQPAFLVNAQHSDGGPLARGITEPLATAAASNRPSLVGLPFLATLRGQSEAHSAVDSLTTVTGGVHHGLVVPPAALIKLRGGEASHLKNAKGLDSAIDTLSSGGNHYLLVSGAAQLSMRDADAMRVAGLDAELRAQGCGPQAALISKAPFIVSHYGTFNASAVDAPVPSVTTIDRHELVSQGENVDVDDCFFRMLQPHEIGAAMAFPDDYVVLGNKRDKVKQFGNAVTPPAMEWLIRQATASLHPEIAA
jgi:DNA (cytosine-5)-methyltransferase 1